jgi:catechol 2,3-dioxygenase-like lactoylglutathione lyase family enzyme
MLPRICIGVEEASERLAEWLEGFEDWSLEIEEVFDAGITWSQSPASTARPSTAARRWRCRSRSSGGFGAASPRGWRCTPTGTRPSKAPGCRSRSGPVSLETASRLTVPLTGARRTQHPTLCSGDMTIQRMDNVLIVVDDLDAAKAFFAELGMELEGEAPVDGRWVDRVVGLNDVRADIAMMRTPDGHSRLELTKFHTPPAVRAEPESAPANTLGIRRIMFAVDDIDDVVARLRSHGAELVGEIAQYEDIYRLCFLRGPEGIIIGLAEQLS